MTQVIHGLTREQLVAQVYGDVDSEALAAAWRIMKIMYGPMPVGGSCQLLAMVQCEIIEGMRNVIQRDSRSEKGGKSKTKGGGF
ncbi:hypothetical protein SOM41_22375 [Enterobacter sp. CFBP8995]|nr:hypothetical protein [Enterobacter sp. CFBP8995]